LTREACPVVEGILRIGGKWRLAVVYTLLSGPKTFTEIKEELGVPAKTLAQTLKYLEAEGIVSRRYTYPPPRVVYALTEKGRDLAPVIEAIRAWALKWLVTER
jgi:DNA-binding HxlR family transcriptional regulator